MTVMTVQHTPGPWKLFEVGEFGRVAPAASNNVSILTTQQEDGQTFAAVYCLADASLIAAAPELLSLAFQYRSDLRHPPAADSIKRRLEAIEAVIIKATD